MFLAATLVGWTGGGHCLSMERWQVAFNIEQFFISVRIIHNVKFTSVGIKCVWANIRLCGIFRSVGFRKVWDSL